MFFSSLGRAVAGAPATDRATAATMPIGRSLFMCSSFLLVVLVSADGVRAGVTCAADERADSVDRRDADEAVDDATAGIGLAELEPEDPGHEIELRYRDEAPIEAADDEQCCGEQVELLHLVHLLYRNCSW